MRRPPLSVLVLAALCCAAPAFASGGLWSKPSTPESSSPGEAVTPRQQAERYYGDAFDEAARARKDLDSGHAKNAEKRFKRVRERAERAVALDSTFHEAWNLVGYAARKTGDYKAAFAAYDRCLALKPDYAPAREYVGEAYAEVGDLVKAREQLAWLRDHHADDDAKELSEAIDAAAAKVPPAAPAATQ